MRTLEEPSHRSKGPRARFGVALLRPEDKELDAKFILQDELVLITSPAHPFAQKGCVHIKDLGEQSLMVMDVSEPSPRHKKIADAFLQSNAPLHLTVKNAPIETIKKMVAIGLGVGFVPLISVREEKARGELAVVDVEGFHLERSVWLVRRRAVQSPSAKALMQTAVAFGDLLRGPVPTVLPAVERSLPSLPFKGEKVTHGIGGIKGQGLQKKRLQMRQISNSRS